MKYIRTKDGMYEVIREILGGEAYEVKVPQSKWEYDEDNKCYYEDSKIDGFCKKDIISQSENLEELCDEFVMTHYFPETNYTKREVLKEDKDLMIKAVRLKKQHNEDKDLKNEFNIYGCIWTDKGLIYVVKMNDEGKLVLI